MQVRMVLLSGTVTKFIAMVKDKQSMLTPLELFIPLHLVFPVMINYKYCKGMPLGFAVVVPMNCTLARCCCGNVYVYVVA